MKTFSLLCVGVLYRDVVLHVPNFPRENSKLRATGRESRAGGNPLNLLRVFKQAAHGKIISYKPGLLCSVGEGAGDGLKLIHAVQEETGAQVGYKLRDGKPVSTAYIIESNTSRTIISLNEVPHPTTAELRELMENVLVGQELTWLHVEGANCQEVGKFLTHLNSNAGTGSQVPKFCSIDFEKWDGEGLWELLPFADVGFFSEDYFCGVVNSKGRDGVRQLQWNKEDEDHSTHHAMIQEFVELVFPLMKPGAVGYIMVGELGSYAFFKVAETGMARFPETEATRSVDLNLKKTEGLCLAYELVIDPPVKAFRIFWVTPCVIPEGKVIETTGAGDTFIATVIYGLSSGLSVVQAGENGNWIAGRKCQQVGFEGLL